MRILARNNELLTILLFCIGIFLYGLGLSKITENGSLSSQSFFIVGGLVFILYHYKRFNITDFKNLLIPIITFSIVFILGILTYFDDVIKHSFSSVLKSANTHILKYFIFFILCYFVAKYIKKSLAHLFLLFFAFLCLFEVFAMIFLGIKNGFLHHPLNVPFFFKAVFTYNIWILAPLAISITSIVVFKGKFKLISLILLSLSIAAMFANSERSFIVAFLVMIFIPLIFWQYKYKKIIIFLLPFIWFISIFGIYHISKDFLPRWNVAYMMDNFISVWNTKPIEMGKYDPSCFDNSLYYVDCYEESLKNGRSQIQWEHSSLSRIAMSKSTFLAFLDNPFFPKTIDVFETGYYLYKYYNNTNHQNRAYIKNLEHDVNGYNHPHNYAISLLFAYGLFGFASILVFIIYILFMMTRVIINSNNHIQKFIALFLCVFISGICTQSIFDVFYPLILQSIFIVIGFGFGFCMRKD